MVTSILMTLKVNLKSKTKQKGKKKKNTTLSVTKEETSDVKK